MAGDVGFVFAVLRYGADGKLDPGFGTGGIATTNVFVERASESTALVLQTDGGIVAAGSAWIENCEFVVGCGDFLVDNMLVRYLPEPSRDLMLAVAIATIQMSTRCGRRPRPGS